jgi:hypothetical protein
VVLVDPHDLTAHPAGNLAQLALLISRGLIDGSDAKIDIYLIDKSQAAKVLQELKVSWRKSAHTPRKGEAPLDE